MNASYHLEEITHWYGERQVLSVAQLQIRSGEILALVGPSGAGKSTLLRLLNFLEWPTGGRLYFGDHLVTPALSLEQKRRVVGVFQRPGLLHRSVVANIGYGVQLRGRVPDPSLLQQWLDRLGLGPLAQQAAAKLSAGEGQRVALARALIIQPDVLLLDEPTANLDPYNVGLIEQIVREEQAQRKMTVVWVTHDLFQARRVAHRVALMVGGQIVEVGEREAFFNRPQSEVAAAFLRGELVYG
ncbi:MAG: ATP-binding cassette domain-containing protein [Anaerolineae bacterium]|nr:ATP-binding cassette domain-containing protein [Anaerolineae bacterium]